MDKYSKTDHPNESSTRGGGSNKISIKNIGVNYWKELKGRLLTKSTILLVMYMFTINTCTVVAYVAAKDLTGPLGVVHCLEKQPESDKAANNIFNLFRNVLFLLIPFTGWLADSKIGRGTAITISLWTGWLGTLLQTLSGCMQYRLCGDTVSFAIAKYGLSTSSLLLMLVSVSFCYANIFSYGLSQLLVVGGSSTKLRAYINWVIWILFLSGNPIFVVAFINTKNPYTANIAVSIISFMVFSFCLCVHFNFNHWFEEVQVENHYQILYKVLKYVWKHKYPVNRSSLTYWNDTMPSRFDFAQNRFGGPFSHEHVETVKTFLRILVVLASLVPFLIASDPIINNIPAYVTQYKNGSNDLSGIAGYVVWFIGDDVILFIIPLLEFVILPLFPKLEFFLINPLKGIGMAMLLLLLSICLLFLFNIVGHVTAVNQNIPCYSLWTPGDPQLGLSFWIVLIPSILSGLADMLSFLCVFEFLCSQAPSGMSGMLIGLYWFIRSICIDISAVLLIILDKYPPKANSNGSAISCFSYLMFILFFLAACGLIVYTLTANWYIKRERNVDLSLRATIEHHFEKQIQKRLQEENVYFDSDSENVVIITK